MFQQPKKIFAGRFVVRKAMEIPGIAGLKDSSGNMAYFHRLQQFLKERPDFTLLVGSEELLGETVLLGRHGGVCGGANLFPAGGFAPPVSG